MRLGQVVPPPSIATRTPHSSSSSSPLVLRTRVAMAPVAALASRTVAVIGAGAAGLAAAKELQREGHRPTVFEQGGTVGGVWVLDEHTESDLLGQDQHRRRVHSSMYNNLRTNLPREVMSYGDLPFHPKAMAMVAKGLRSPVALSASAAATTEGQQEAGSALSVRAPPDVLQCESVDPRRYCSHAEVLRYLRSYALYHDLPRLVQFDTEVLEVVPEENPGPSPQQQQQQQHHHHQHEAPFRWRVTTQHAQRGLQQHSFDAVVVCNGHYSHPHLPDIEGMGTFPAGRQLHSHNYRAPEPYAGQVVLVVGASNSGEDISRELSATCRRVLLAAKDWTPGDLAAEPYGEGSNIHRVPIPERLTADGRAVFPDGREEHLDTIIYATGYRYEFPMLTGGQPSTQQGTELVGLGGVRTHVRFVSPLYLHLFPASPLAPWCSFIGIPWKIVPFPQMELQARLVARALSGRVTLPSPEGLQEHEASRVKALLESGAPMRYLHNQNVTQFAYNEELVRLTGTDVEPLPRWREEMYYASGKLKRGDATIYRDAAWPEPDFLRRMEAHVAEQLEALEQALREQQALVEQHLAAARL